MSEQERQITVSISQDTWDKLFKAGQSGEYYGERTAEYIAYEVLTDWAAKQK